MTADTPPTPGRAALASLLSSNASFVRGAPPPASTRAARAALVSGGQHPIAAVLTCADSRVSPAHAFCAAPGTLFVVRNAGNTAVDDATLGSLEYAVGALQVPLVLVLGHSGCGAVAAAQDGLGGEDGCLQRHVARIARGIAGGGGVEDNVREAVQRLRGLACEVVGAVYDLESGVVAELAEEKAAPHVGEAVTSSSEEDEGGGDGEGEEGEEGERAEAGGDAAGVEAAM